MRTSLRCSIVSLGRHLALLLSVHAYAGCGVSPGAPEPAPISVVSLNLRCLVDDWDTRLPIVADALAAQAPMLIGLEEVCAGLGRDNLPELAAALGARTGRSYNALRAVTHRSWNDTYDEGVALLAAWPIAASTIVDLPPGVFPRRLLLARVSTPLGAVVFGATHFDYQSPTPRAAEAMAATAAVRSFTQSDEPAIVTGDLNETPEGGSVYSTFLTAALTDVWAAQKPGDSGYTFPATGPTARIDYIWLLAQATGVAPRQITRVLDVAQGGVYGSDHLGLSATFTR